MPLFPITSSFSSIEPGKLLTDVSLDGRASSVHEHDGDLHFEKDEAALKERLKFNVTHTIRQLSFGPVIPNVEQPLAGVRQVMSAGTFFFVLVVS